MKKLSHINAVTAIMFCFFTMGIADMDSIATNYIKADMSLTDTMANIFPSMVLLCFLFFSIPTGILINKVGRKKTVLISLIITLLGLIPPIFGTNFFIMFTSFCLLGIGNVLMQVSVNLLVTNVIQGDNVSSTITLGQFIKTVASFSGPLITAWGAIYFLGGLGWKIIYPIFIVIDIITLLYLWSVQIKETTEDYTKNISISNFVKLLKDGFLLLCFFCIFSNVGIDVGLSVTAPKLLQEKLNIGLDEAGFSTSFYYLLRIVGCLSGTFILKRISNLSFFIISTLLIVMGMIGLFIFDTQLLLYISIGLIGYGNSNTFPIVYSEAIAQKKDKQNEISSLMIMALFGGAVFLLFMGIVSDAMGTQIGALIVMSAAVVYYIIYSYIFSKKVTH
ncbi:MAG: MFS transporter [Bacteroidales bacterium]